MFTLRPFLFLPLCVFFSGIKNLKPLSAGYKSELNDSGDTTATKAFSETSEKFFIGKVRLKNNSPVIFQQNKKCSSSRSILVAAVSILR